MSFSLSPPCFCSGENLYKKFVLVFAIFLYFSGFLFGEVLLKFKPDVSLNRQKEIIFLSSSTPSDFIEEIRLWKISPNNGILEKNVIDFLRKFSEVLYCNKSKKVRLFGSPSDPYFASGYQWGLSASNGIDMTDAWDISGSSGISSVVIAVIDTGVDYTHEDLKNKMWQSPDGYYGYDFVNNDYFPMDDYGHGTHVAGIAAAETNNNVGIAGVAVNPRIMALKILDSSGSGDEFNEAKAIVWATENGADVINMSLGSSEYSAAEADACQYAFDKGVFIAAASGNDNLSTVYYPASLPTTFAVGAVDENGNRCTESDWGAGYGSNYGANLDVVAPGDRIWSSVPPSIYGTSYQAWNGTSMATPFVSGLAAIVRSIRPDFGPGDIAEAIKRSASDYPSFTEYKGYGLVNAKRCVELLTTYVQNLTVSVTPFPNPLKIASGVNLKFGFQDSPQKIKDFKIFDFSGRIVASLGNSDYYSSRKIVAWDGRNKNGDYVSAGIYFFYVNTDIGVAKGRFAVVK